jgi:hypothetical protein
MVDLRHSWVRFRDLPDDMLDDMPEHVRDAFLAARLHRFEIEMLCAGAKVPAARRAPRRFVLVADDLDRDDAGGPIGFDLAALATDARLARRVFVISTAGRADLYAATYAAAVEDLADGWAATVVVETRQPFAESWARTLSALQERSYTTNAHHASRPRKHLA